MLNIKSFVQFNASKHKDRNKANKTNIKENESWGTIEVWNKCQGGWVNALQIINWLMREKDFQLFLAPKHASLCRLAYVWQMRLVLHIAVPIVANIMESPPRNVISEWVLINLATMFHSPI